ncbi:MAG: ribosomal protein S18-alanine N-acetyltransferase [Smithellaceae bacterium]|jgi:ribosomal-protein-alanine N-acetyltransferase|nr:ribosomal protein S18-alanine N-acetyltransferase [Syntrophaceae bacterium]
MSFDERPSSLTVDLMSEEDLPEILAIEHEAQSAPWTEGMFIEEMKAPRAHCLSVKAKDRGQSFIAAYIVFRFVADELHLHNLAVRRECRRQGLGSNLLNLMKDIGLQAGITSRTLEVRASNREAIGLYEKCGFSVKGRRLRYYDDTKEDALIMWAENLKE